MAQTPYEYLGSLSPGEIEVVTTEGFQTVPALCGKIFAINRCIQTDISVKLSKGSLTLLNMYTLTHINLQASMIPQTQKLPLWQAACVHQQLEEIKSLQFKDTNSFLKMSRGSRVSVQHQILEAINQCPSVSMF